MRKLWVLAMMSVVAIQLESQQATPGAASTPSEAAHSTARVPAAKPLLPVAGPENGASSTQSSLSGQLFDLKSYLNGRRGVIEIPPNAPEGWWPGLGNSGLRFLDDRGSSNPDVTGSISPGSIGGYKVGFANALLFRATETDPGSPDHYTGFSNVQFHYTAAKGGINNFNGTGQKTDYFNLLVTSEMRTVGQKSGVTSRLVSYSNGDSMGLQTGVTQFGGYDTSGDEQTEGIRVQVQQGSSSRAGSGGIFEGVVRAIDGHTLTYAPSKDEYTLGEHRIIRDLDQAYSAGSIASISNSGGSPNTVRIVGRDTHWSTLGIKMHTDWNLLAAGGNVTNTTLAFCFDPLKGDGYDMCFPVHEVLDDTHITLNLTSTGPQQNTGWPSSWPTLGTYRIYGAAWPTTVDLEAHTLTAPDLSAISKGHKIDQVLAYNMQVVGEWIAMSRHIGFPGGGGGSHITNWGTQESPRMGFGLGVSGAFETALAFQGSNAHSGVPNYFARLYSDPSSKILLDSAPVQTPGAQIALWRAGDSTGALHLILSFLREKGAVCLVDTSFCVMTSGSVAARQLGQAESGDYAGTIVIQGSTTATVEFKRPFQSAPVCSLTPTSDPSEFGAYWVTTSKSAVTANVHRATKATFDYVCVGNPN
jgi:hypothetical protein